jgi:chromosome segregation ATPase
MRRSPSPSSPANGSSTPEWSSAVGHAATGKSGRVIHNLQEEIARLTRELSLQRSRAEETQRNNDTLKAQLQATQEYLRNAESTNEAHLRSISRRDRKIAELQEIAEKERKRRENAESEAANAQRLMLESKDEFHRESSHLLEIANHSKTQYEALAKSSQRDKGDLARRIKMIRDEISALRKESEKKDLQLDRLDVIMGQKNRELESATERADKAFAAYQAYKTENDRELRRLIEEGQRHDAKVQETLSALKDAEDKYKWAVHVKKEIDWAQ